MISAGGVRAATSSLVGLLLATALAVADDERPRVPSDLPEDAGRLVAEQEDQADEVRRKAEETIAARKAELIQQLEKLQNQHAKAGRLDAAAAIRERVRQLRGGYRIGQAVEVLWGGRWWDAQIRKIEGEQYRIHYTGWDDGWDETVPPARVRRK